jgi:Raf kinase inhibitor-like YbhB/YbcL family protein
MLRATRNPTSSPVPRSSASRPITAVWLVASLLCLATSASFESKAIADSKTFTLSSPDLAAGTFAAKHVLNGFGCTGQNVSPELVWSNPPAGTKSFALLVQDLDAPTGSGFWHWAVYDIPASTTKLVQGAGNGTLPPGAFGGNTDFLDTGATKGNGNYGGPCPPAGDAPHRYVFTLYALGVDKVEVAGGIPKTGTAALYSFILNKGIGAGLLGKASFTTKFGR